MSVVGVSVRYVYPTPTRHLREVFNFIGENTFAYHNKKYYKI